MPYTRHQSFIKIKHGCFQVVDKDEKEWQKALGEEKLPWPQFLAAKELVKNVGSLYNITSIPTFLLIDPNGKIIFSGHSNGELETELAKL